MPMLLLISTSISSHSCRLRRLRSFTIAFLMGWLIQCPSKSCAQDDLPRLNPAYERAFSSAQYDYESEAADLSHSHDQLLIVVSRRPKAQQTGAQHFLWRAGADGIIQEELKFSESQSASSGGCQFDRVDTLSVATNERIALSGRSAVGQSI